MAAHRLGMSVRAPRLRLACAVLLAAIAVLSFAPSRSGAFVGTLGAPLTVSPSLRATSQPLPRLILAASEQEASDAIMVQDDEEFDDEDTSMVGYPDEALAEYPFDEDPPASWFERRRIDRHKVNMVFFDMYKKPKSFFPHDLRPGDTIRVSFKDPVFPKEAEKDAKVNKGFAVVDYSKTREIFTDGVIMNFKGEYHSRTVHLRTMVGKGIPVGYELIFPMHSPLITGIQVLRRGYIGNNKNAYFVRGLIGKKNQIPIDKEREERDKLYAELREEGRADEIPEPDYPQTENERYPLPVWKQDMDDWDESEYDPAKVDQRTEYQKEILGKWKDKYDPNFKP